MSLIALLLACSGPAPTEEPGTSVPTPTDEPADTGVDTDDTDTDDTDEPEPPFRPEQLVCGEPPPVPTTFTNLPGFGPHEDFGFDAVGNLIGVNGNGNLAGRNRSGQVTLISPAVGEAKGTRYLPDGTVAIALAAEGSIGKVLPDGQMLTLASVSAPNGIAVDIHNNVWVAAGSGVITRVSPSGDQLIAAQIPNTTLDGIAFAPDFRKLYFNSEFGRVRVLDIDDDGNPVGDARFFADVPLGLGAILDGMTTDMCGNVYVARMDGRVWRFTPDGEQAGVINFNLVGGFVITPAVNFGSGVGGFDRNKLYAQNFLGGVIEADIGIDGRWEPHYPLPQ